MTTIVLTAGGTGGHLFPAQALAAELIRRGRKIVVMTDARGKNYNAAFPGASIETVPSASFADRNVVSLFLAPFEIVAGVVTAFGKLLRLKPAAVVGFGGYPSLPVMLAAIVGRYPTATHEANAIPGRVNRLVADRVRAVAGSLPFARFAPRDANKVVYTGNPVRPEAAALAGAPYETPSGRIRLLIFGGSQGAHALSEIVPAAIARLPAGTRARLDIVQQCRPEDLDAVRAAYAKADLHPELAGFFTDLPARMAKAHLVISRSGASTAAELAVIGRPSILIPFPFATDDHQTANAQVLADAGAAWTVQQGDLSPEKLAAMLADVFDNPAELAKRAAAARALGKPDAAQRLADLVDKLGEGR